MRARETVVSHFVVQRAVFTVAIALFPVARPVLLSMREYEDFGVCWKLSAAEQVKPDCCHTPAVVSTLLTPLPVSCPLTTPHHYIYILVLRFYVCIFVDLVMCSVLILVGEICPAQEKWLLALQNKLQTQKGSNERLSAYCVSQFRSCVRVEVDVLGCPS